MLGSTCTHSYKYHRKRARVNNMLCLTGRVRNSSRRLMRFSRLLIMTMDVRDTPGTIEQQLLKHPMRLPSAL